jgi:hypothetical protein
VCPTCGSSADVRTVQQLFDLLNSFDAGASPQAEELRASRREPPHQQPDTRLSPTEDPAQNQPDQQLANVILDTAGHFLGKAIGKRVRRSLQERVVSTLEAQAGQQASQQNQVAIIQRYPQPRGCLHDAVLFLAGAARVVPISDLRFSILLAEADELVGRLGSA